MMLISEIVSKLGLDERDGVLSRDGSEINFCCPFCVTRGEPTPDRKYRFSIHIKNDNKFGLYNCFRCEKRGRITLDSKFIGKVNYNSLLKKLESKESPVRLPAGFLPLVTGMKAYDYLTSRGLSPDDIIYYGIGIWNGRILFPDYLGGRLVYWVARIYDQQDNKMRMKYYNCPGAKRSGQLYNLGRFLLGGSRSIVITEGPISAIMAGRDAIATYGKEFTRNQVDLLRSLELETIYIALDPDAKPSGLKLAKSLSCVFKDIRLINMPDNEDPASLGRRKFLSFKESAVPYSDYDKVGHLEFLYG